MESDKLFDATSGSTTNTQKLIISSLGSDKSATIDFQFSADQESLFSTLCDRIRNDLGIAPAPPTEMPTLTATVAGESFQVSGDSQLRNMLVSMQQQQDQQQGGGEVKIMLSSRRRSVGSVLGHAVAVSCTSKMPKDRDGETATFKFRYLPDDMNLLSDFKDECIDCLDLYASENNTVDIEVKNDATGATDLNRVTTDAAFRSIVETFATTHDDAAAQSDDNKVMEVWLVPASLATVATPHTATANTETIFESSGRRDTHKLVVSSEKSSNTEETAMDFVYMPDQESLFASLCEKIHQTLGLSPEIAAASSDKDDGGVVFTLATTVQGETFDVNSDSQLRDILTTIQPDQEIHMKLSWRRRNIDNNNNNNINNSSSSSASPAAASASTDTTAEHSSSSVIKKAVMVSCTSQLEEQKGDCGTFRFRYQAPQSAEQSNADKATIVDDFKLQCIECLDLFSTTASQFDVELQDVDDNTSWKALTSSSSSSSSSSSGNELCAVLDKFVEHGALVMQIRLVPSAAPASTTSASASNQQEEQQHQQHTQDRNSPKVHVECGSDQKDVDVAFGSDENLLQSLTSATAGAFNMSYNTEVKLFGVHGETGERQQLVSDDDARAVIADNLRIIAVQEFEKVHVVCEIDGGKKTLEKDVPLGFNSMQSDLLKSLQAATAGTFEMSPNSELQLFAVTDTGDRREILDDITTRMVLAEKLPIHAVASHFVQKPKDIAISYALVDANKATIVQDVAHDVVTTDGCFQRFFDSAAAALKLDLSLGDTLELFRVSEKADDDTNQQQQQQQQQQQITDDDTFKNIVESAHENTIDVDDGDQDDDDHDGQSQQQDFQKRRGTATKVVFRANAQLHPNRRPRTITVRCTDMPKRGVDYIEVVESPFEFTPISNSKSNENMIRQLRTLVASSLNSVKPKGAGPSAIDEAVVNDEGRPYILEANLDGEWLEVVKDRAAFAMLKALTENGAGFVSLRVRPPPVPPAKHELEVRVCFHGTVFVLNNVTYVAGTTADVSALVVELKKLCKVPYSTQVSLQAALPASRTDRAVATDARLTELFAAASEIPEYLQPVLLRLEESVSASEAATSKTTRSIAYTASFQGAASVTPQEARVDVDTTNPNLLSDLKDLLLDHLRVPRMSGDDIDMFVALTGNAGDEEDEPQHMMDNGQLVDFLYLVGDEQRLRVVFRANSSSSSSSGGADRSIVLKDNNKQQGQNYQQNDNKFGPHLTRAQIIRDIADCWLEQAGGGQQSSSSPPSSPADDSADAASNAAAPSSYSVSMEDVRIAFTTWTEMDTFDSNKVCLQRFNDLVSWCSQVAASEVEDVIRSIVSHLSDFALARFRTHARDMANFVGTVSSHAQSSKLLSASFRAYAVDGAVSHEFLLKGLSESSIATRDKAESVLSAYSDSLSEEDFVEVLTYFVDDDAMALHKVLCAAAPKRPHWIGSPKSDAEVSQRHETRTRIALRHVLDDLTVDSLVDFAATFAARSAARSLAWCVACVLQHASASSSSSSSEPTTNDNNQDSRPRSLVVVDTAASAGGAAADDGGVDGDSAEEEAAWSWLTGSLRNAAAAENFLMMLRTTATVPISRNSLAVVASKLLSVELERSNLLPISPVLSELAHWCSLVCQLTCSVRCVSWPPEFVPSQPDYAVSQKLSPRAQRIVAKNTQPSPPRQTEAFQLAGISPRSARRPGSGHRQNNNNNNNYALAVMVPSPPAGGGGSQSSARSIGSGSGSGSGSGNTSARFKPRYDASTSYNVLNSPPQTLAEAMKSADETKNAAAGAVMQTQLHATHLLITICSASGLSLLSAAGGRVHISVVDADEKKGDQQQQQQDEEEVVLRTPAVSSSSSSSASDIQFPISQSRFVSLISGPKMGYIFRVYCNDSFVCAGKWTIASSQQPDNDKLAIKLFTNKDGTTGNGGSGHLAVQISRQLELANIPEDITDAMIQVNYDSMLKSSGNDAASADAMASGSGSKHAYVRAVNTSGDTVFTLKDDARSVVFELERAIPHLTVQRVVPHVAGDEVTDCVDINAKKLVASRFIEEALKPASKLESTDDPFLIKLTSIGFQAVPKPPPKDEKGPEPAGGAAPTELNEEEEL